MSEKLKIVKTPKEISWSQTFPTEYSTEYIIARSLQIKGELLYINTDYINVHAASSYQRIPLDAIATVTAHIIDRSSEYEYQMNLQIIGCGVVLGNLQESTPVRRDSNNKRFIDETDKKIIDDLADEVQEWILTAVKKYKNP